MDALTLAGDLVFTALFVVTLANWIRRPEPVQLAIVLVFGALAPLFVVELLRFAGVEAPLIVRRFTTVCLLVQPLLTLRLVSLVRNVPRTALLAAGVGAFATIAAVFVLPSPVPVAITLGIVGVFVGTQLAAAILLLAEARRRAGATGTRFLLAALATGTFALAIIAVAAAAVAPGVTGASVGVGRGLAAIAGIGYLFAFAPPAWARRLWQAGATVRYMPRLIAISRESETAIWQQLADAAHDLAATDGATAVIAGGTDGSASLVAVSGYNGVPLGETISRAEFERLRLEATGKEADPSAFGPLVERLASHAHARFISAVAIPEPDETRPAVLVLLNRHRRLFVANDIDLIAALGAQSAILAERRSVLAEQEALTAQLAATVEALRGASQAKSDFLASMSHELRTPLSAILGFSELMRLEERDGDRASVPVEWIEHVHRGGEHLLALINDVLDLTKVEAGRLELQRESFDLGLLIAESTNGLRPLAERKRLRLEASVRGVTVVADRGRLRQILYNLLSNAIKYTPDGGRVAVSASQDDGLVRIEVADTGAGIAPEDHAAVFEEFRQVGDPKNQQPGTGLGLALTRRLVEAHGGTIGLESAVGAGSRFTVTLPVPADSGAAEVGAGAGSSDMAPTSDVPGREAARVRGDVLVIEDDPSAIRLLREYLEADGYRLRISLDGEAGIVAARANPPAAIVLDVLLPGIDGWEVLRRLKADPALREIPVVIVTVVDEREMGLALGAVDYLVKPISREALLRSLARWTFPPLSAGERRRVLAVDDDPAALSMIRATLEPEGFAVVCVTSGQEAIDLARAEPFDLVVCDLVMPEVDGFEVVSQLRHEPRTAELPILICTAHDLDEADKERLKGTILGIVEKGPDAWRGLRAWLAQVAGRDGHAPAD